MPKHSRKCLNDSKSRKKQNQISASNAKRGYCAAYARQRSKSNNSSEWNIGPLEENAIARMADGLTNKLVWAALPNP